MQPISIGSCMLLGKSLTSHIDASLKGIMNFIRADSQLKMHLSLSTRDRSYPCEYRNRTPPNSGLGISIRYIATEIGLVYSTIHNTITNYLKLKKLCSRRVPHFLTEEKNNCTSTTRRLTRLRLLMIIFPNGRSL